MTTRYNKDTKFCGLVKQALAVKKPNRREAAHLLAQFMQGEEINLSTLYAHFLETTVSTRPPTRQAWLNKAIAGSLDDRLYLHYLHSDGKRMAATNGHILNVCEFNDEFRYDEGYYDGHLAPLPSKSALKYPNIDRVIPKDTYSETYALKDLEVTAYPTTSDAEPVIAYKIGKGYFDYRILMIALRHRGGFTVLNADAGETDAIKILGPFPDSFSVVMPMRV